MSSHLKNISTKWALIWHQKHGAYKEKLSDSALTVKMSVLGKTRPREWEDKMRAGKYYSGPGHCSGASMVLMKQALRRWSVLSIRKACNSDVFTTHICTKTTQNIHKEQEMAHRVQTDVRNHQACSTSYQLRKYKSNHTHHKYTHWRTDKSKNYCRARGISQWPSTTEHVQEYRKQQLHKQQQNQTAKCYGETALLSVRSYSHSAEQFAGFLQ